MVTLVVSGVGATAGAAAVVVLVIFGFWKWKKKRRGQLRQHSGKTRSLFHLCKSICRSHWAVSNRLHRMSENVVTT